jgi:hypothetical protein
VQSCPSWLFGFTTFVFQTHRTRQSSLGVFWPYQPPLSFLPCFAGSRPGTWSWSSQQRENRYLGRRASMTDFFPVSILKNGRQVRNISNCVSLKPAHLYHRHDACHSSPLSEIGRCIRLSEPHGSYYRTAGKCECCPPSFSQLSLSPQLFG